MLMEIIVTLNKYEFIVIYQLVILLKNLSINKKTKWHLRSLCLSFF